MNFHKRLNISGVSASVCRLIPSDVRLARRLSNSFERYEGIGIVEAVFDRKASSDCVRRGAEAFAVWIAARRFVAENLPSRNSEGCLISQVETSIILLTQLVMLSDKRHPAFLGLEVKDFLASLHDAFTAYALDLTLSVRADKSGMSAQGFVDDPSDDLGGCCVGTGVESKDDKLLPKPFAIGLFERCARVEGKRYSSSRMLFDRITVELGDWRGLLDFMDKPAPRQHKPRRIRSKAPRALFVDLAQA